MDDEKKILAKQLDEIISRNDAKFLLHTLTYAVKLEKAQMQLGQKKNGVKDRSAR